MDISIIIVNWNAKYYLRECIMSLLKNINDIKYEIIVVDNDSSDGSQDMVIMEFPGVILIRSHNNLGFAKANNIGIHNSKGIYLCLINSDIVLLKDCLDKMYKYIKCNNNVGMLGPKILNPDRTLQPSCMGFPSLWNMFCRAIALDKIFPNMKWFCGRLMSYWPHDKLKIVDVLNGCFWLVRKDALHNVGLLDENFFMYGEDIDWCKRFRDAGWKVVFYPEAESIHYGGASSSNAPIKYYVEMYKADLQYWKKHHNLVKYYFYKMITWLHHILRILGQTFLFIVNIFNEKSRSSAVFKIKRSIDCVVMLTK